jgi:phospholipid/cholesterol/gamma-HCH transport system permease protein
MLRALREIEGGVKLSLNVAARLPRLRRPPVFESFLRQVYFTGVMAATGLVLRASALGVLIIAIMMDVLDADADLAVKILLWAVFREIGPLAAAMVVILRSGSAIAAEMAVMRVSGETDTLRYFEINLYDYLVLPRVLGVTIATAAITFYIQFLAVLGGLLFAPLVIDASFVELFGGFTSLFSPVDLFYSVVKSLLFGFSIAAICCYQGLHPPELSQNAVPKVVTRAVTQSAMFVLGINAVFAYVVYGILFFGLVKAKV